MHHHGHDFLLAMAVYLLLGVVLVVRAFITSSRMARSSDMVAQQREVQRQFRIVAVIMLSALAVLLGVYYVTQP
ncbi:MAG: hypothetical protein JO250_08045 [Armatimonadetes bacterium]|nr:hypothetical protein [Armatimonadota bacterium]